MYICKLIQNNQFINISCKNKYIENILLSFFLFVYIYNLYKLFESIQPKFDPDFITFFLRIWVLRLTGLNGSVKNCIPNLLRLYTWVTSVASMYVPSPKRYLLVLVIVFLVPARGRETAGKQFPLLYVLDVASNAS